MSALKRFLVPTDFSPASDLALDYAIDLAARVGASIHVIHVIEERSFAAAYPDGFFAEIPGLRVQMIDDANRRLADGLSRCGQQRISTTSEVAMGHPARVIGDCALHRGTDLIVMGTHGRSGFAHLLLGSVAERVVRTAPCPVLTVRETGRVADMMAASVQTAATA